LFLPAEGDLLGLLEELPLELKKKSGYGHRRRGKSKSKAKLSKLIDLSCSDQLLLNARKREQPSIRLKLKGDSAGKLGK